VIHALSNADAIGHLRNQAKTDATISAGKASAQNRETILFIVIDCGVRRRLEKARGSQSRRMKLSLAEKTADRQQKKIS